MKKTRVTPEMETVIADLFRANTPPIEAHKLLRKKGIKVSRTLVWERYRKLRKELADDHQEVETIALAKVGRSWRTMQKLSLQEAAEMARLRAENRHLRRMVRMARLALDEGEAD